MLYPYDVDFGPWLHGRTICFPLSFGFPYKCTVIRFKLDCSCFQSLLTKPIMISSFIQFTPPLDNVRDSNYPSVTISTLLSFFTTTSYPTCNLYELSLYFKCYQDNSDKSTPAFSFTKKCWSFKRSARQENTHRQINFEASYVLQYIEQLQCNCICS